MSADDKDQNAPPPQGPADKSGAAPQGEGPSAAAGAGETKPAAAAGAPEGAAVPEAGATNPAPAAGTLEEAAATPAAARPRPTPAAGAPEGGAAAPGAGATKPTPGEITPEGAAATPAAARPKPTPAAGAPVAGAAAAPAGADGAPARPARAAAGPSPAEIAQRAEAPSVPLARLRERFPEIAKSASFFAGVAIVEVPAAALVEVCRFLKEDQQADCKYLSNLHGNHNPDRPRPFEVVYNLYSISNAQWIELKAEIAEGEEVPTVATVWKTACWHEREAFDLLGIRFSGHTGLKRILLPDDWVGHPLRKEYPLEGKEGDHRLYR